MRFDFKPASLKHGAGTLTVAHDGESTLEMQATVGARQVERIAAKRVFHGHTTAPERPRYYLLKKPDGGYILRRVHEVCQLALSGTASSSRKTRRPATSGRDGAPSRPTKQRRLSAESAAAEEAGAASVSESLSSDSSSSSSDDPDAIAQLEAELLA